MTICFFGTYDAQYGRTSTLRDGLIQAGVRVVEAHFPLPLEQLEVAEDATLSQSIRRILRKIRTWFYLFKQSRTVRESDAVVVLHPGHLDLPVAWLLCKLYSRPLIFDTHISPYDTLILGRDLAKKGSMKEIILKWSEWLLLRLPDRVFTDTHMMKQFISDTFAIAPHRIFTVPIGASDTVFKPSRLKQKSKRIRVLFFGMYNPLHGAWHIVKAIGLLKKHKNLEFVLIGDGPIKDKLVSAVRNWGMKNVTFKGFMPERELVQEIKRADILLGTFSDSPIMRRVIPNKIFGSIACRKPVITARQPILEEYFNHKKDIFFVKPEDASSLASAIAEMGLDDSLREDIAANGYRLYRRLFTPLQIGMKLIDGIFHDQHDVYIQKDQRYSRLQKSSMIAGMRASIEAHFIKPHIQRIACKRKVGDYVLVFPIRKNQKLCNFAHGVYQKNGRKYFVKTWNHTRKNLAYYSAINEFRVNRLLSPKLRSLSSPVHVPRAIEIIQGADGSLSFVYENISSKALSGTSSSVQLKSLDIIVSELSRVSACLTQEERSYFNKRGILFYLISLPMITLLSIRSYPSLWRAYLKAFFHCYYTLPMSRAEVVTHRDLHADNVKISKKSLYLLDCEDLVLTIPNFDRSDLGLLYSFKYNTIPESAVERNTDFLETYIAIHRSGNTLREDYYKQFLVTKYG